MSFFRFCCRSRGLACGAVGVLMLAAYGCSLWMKLAADFVSIDVQIETCLYLSKMKPRQ